MKATREMLTALGACSEAIEFVMKSGLDRVPMLDGLARLQRMPHHKVRRWVEWFVMAMETPAFVKFSGDYTVTGYVVFNPKTGQHEPFATLPEVTARREALIAEELVALRKRFVVKAEIKNGDGDTALEPVDLP